MADDALAFYNPLSVREFQPGKSAGIFFVGKRRSGYNLYPTVMDRFLFL